MSNDCVNHRFCKQIPEGDDRERMICTDCGWIHYENPKIIVGAVATWEDRLLLCRRGIEPRKGYWTIPAGFMELCETAEQGAAREAWEEARARLKIGNLLGLYSIPRAAQVHMIYRARMLTPDFGPGPESLEVKLVAWEDIPWEDLAFLSNHWALRHFHLARDWDDFPPFSVPEEDVEKVAIRPC
ncbi:MAG: NUDIX hydrolase [Planctomycetaceae bacterium]|nr:NUDIX hydrolase [Planctomycetaceae bacterium]